MKKLFLFVSAITIALTFNSCSSDDNSDSSSNNGITATVNGVTKTFNTIDILENTYEDENGVEQIYLDIEAKIDNNAGEVIYFQVDKGDIGSDKMSGFYYFVNNKYYSYGGGFEDNITVNNGSTLKGTFSGVVSVGMDDSQFLTFTNGSVNINY